MSTPNVIESAKYAKEVQEKITKFMETDEDAKKMVKFMKEKIMFPIPLSEKEIKKSKEKNNSLLSKFRKMQKK